MLVENASTRFKKDLKLCQKRGYKMRKIFEVIERLKRKDPLDARNRPHLLVGDWDGAMECHIEPDWLLIYKVIGNELELYRTGTHSDLFRK
jgi:mRNA interferase YafQ